MTAETETLEALQAQMGAAIDDERYEDAAALLARIQTLGGGPGPGSRLRRQEPGKMGLGTDLPAHVPPKGWTPPKPPDLMTKGHKGRGGRER